MSRNALILEKAEAQTFSAAPLQSVSRSGDYVDLIRRVFRSHSVLAVIGTGSGSRTGEACRGIAAGLAASGKRVVIAQVNSSLLANPLPAKTGYLPGHVLNVWRWPSSADDAVEFFHSSPDSQVEFDWLGALRRDFDAVLLECPGTVEATEIAVLPDTAVLVAEAGQTTRQQIRGDQRVLEGAEIKLAGCILMQRR